MVLSRAPFIPAPYELCLQMYLFWAGEVSCESSIHTHVFCLSLGRPLPDLGPMAPIAPKAQVYPAGSGAWVEWAGLVLPAGETLTSHLLTWVHPPTRFSL